MPSLWRDILVGTFQNVAGRLANLLPNLLAMLTLVVVGLAVATLLGAAVTRLLRAVKFGARCERWGLQQALARAAILREPERLVGSVVFWIVFLVFATMGVDALQLPGMGGGATFMIVQLIPHVLVAILLLVAGWLLANFVANAILIASVNARIAEARILARLVRWAVLAFTLAAVLTQIGIGSEMVMIAFGLTFGGVVLAAALAFGLGARDLAREFLERRFRPREPQDVPENRITHV